MTSIVESRVVELSIVRTSGALLKVAVEVGPRTTILDALEEVRTTSEPSLLYGHSCHHGSCGTCGLLANGKPVLACTTLLIAFEGPVTVAPLPTVSLVGDLAVASRETVRNYPDGAPYLRASEDGPGSVVPTEIQGHTRFESCIECGLCMAACPVIVENRHRFLGPAPLAAYARMAEDTPDRVGRASPAFGPEGVSQCDREFLCSTVCPTAVAPGRKITELIRSMPRS